MKHAQLILAVLVIALYVSSVTEGRRRGKSVYKSYRRWKHFRTDKAIRRYLKWYDTDSMIWKCRNAIKRYMDWNPNEPISSVEIYCEVIGRVQSLDWYHNGQKLKIGGRYSLIGFPHYRKGRYFTKWIDYRFRIQFPKTQDSGIYTVVLKGLSGKEDKLDLFVDISRYHKKINKYRKQYQQKQQNEVITKQ